MPASAFIDCINNGTLASQPLKVCILLCLGSCGIYSTPHGIVLNPWHTILQPFLLADWIYPQATYTPSFCKTIAFFQTSVRPFSLHAFQGTGILRCCKLIECCAAGQLGECTAGIWKPEEEGADCCQQCSSIRPGRPGSSCSYSSQNHPGGIRRSYCCRQDDNQFCAAKCSKQILAPFLISRSDSP